MKFPDASGVPANMLSRSDMTAFEQLKWLLDREGKNLASADGLGLLANVGLIAGRPSSRTRKRARSSIDLAFRNKAAGFTAI